MAEPITVTIEDDEETIRIDPDTGAMEETMPDGSVVVRLDDFREKPEQDETWFADLSDKIDSSKLNIIANGLIDAISSDDDSRAEALAQRSLGLERIGIKLESPESSAEDAIEGMSKVSNPLLLENCLRSWANSSAELLPASGPVKVKEVRPDSSIDDGLAERLEQDFNHYLTDTAKEYYPDTSHMLLWGNTFGGSGFKKVYRCPLRRRPVSESVDMKDLIVSDASKDFSVCARITHQISMRPSLMKRMQVAGIYRDITLTQPTPQPSQVDETIGAIQGTATQQSKRPEDQPYTVWETQCELDLDEFAPEQFKGKGVALPYLVSLDKDSQQVLAIRRDWDEDDENCMRLQMYVKYPYVPGPGFYGTGLLHILGNATQALTAAWREALDAGMLANFPGGLISKQGARQNSSTMRMSPGEFAPVDTGGLPIQQSVMAMPYRDVTPGLMTLIQQITEQCKQLGSAAELPAAEGLANVPVGTMLAQIEQATKIMLAAHKGMHQAQSEELQLLARLFKENPEDFWRCNKECPRDYWNEQKLLAALESCNLVPVSDPNVPSHIHRVAKALGLIQLAHDPVLGTMLDPEEILRRVLSAMREDPKGLVKPAPPAQPAPEDQAKMITAQAKTMEAQAKIGKLQIDQGGQNADQQLKLAELRMGAASDQAELQKEMIIHASDQAKLEAAERRDAVTMAVKIDADRQKAAMTEAKHGLELVKEGLSIQREDQDHQNRMQVERVKQGLASSKAMSDQLMAERNHALQREGLAIERDKAAADAAVKAHTALNPPKPAAQAKPKARPKGKGK